MSYGWGYFPLTGDKWGFVMRVGSWAQQGEARDDSCRDELLRGPRGARGGGGGAPALGGGPPGTRTAEEIKAAYGRSTNSRRHAPLRSFGVYQMRSVFSQINGNFLIPKDINNLTTRLFRTDKGPGYPSWRGLSENPGRAALKRGDMMHCL